MGELDHAAVGGHLRLLFEAGTVTGVSDGHLLEMFASRRDELAFTALVERHGPMVQRVCHAVLGDHHDAQDAFQATFLVLARSARSIRRRDSLASWLYGVALRVAAGARSASARRRKHERNWAVLRAVETEGGTDSPDDIEALLHREIGRLPERFRAPVVLCYLEGRTYEEAAQVLRCPVGTIKSRLSTARERLRRRLEHRDPATSAGSVGLVLQGGGPMTTVPPPLPASTLQAVIRNATGGPAPASISRLTQGVLQTMLRHRLFHRLGVAAAILIGTGALAAGAIGLARRSHDVPGNGERGAAAPALVVARQAPTRNLAPEESPPPGATMRFGSALYRHPSPIQDLAVSLDGKVAVANSGTCRDNALRTYDLATGRVFPAIDRGGTDGSIAVSPDGKTLATFERSSHSISLFDMTTGAEAARIPLPDAGPGVGSDVILFAADGRHLVKAADVKSMVLIDLARREVVRTIPTPGTVFAAALSPDGRHLVAGGFDYEHSERGWFALKWDVNTGRELDRLPLGKGGIRCVAYSPDGATIAIGGETRKPGSVRLVEAATGKERLKVPLPDASKVRSLAFSPDGTTLAASGGIVHPTVRHRDRQGTAEDRPGGDRAVLRAGRDDARRGGRRHDLPMGRGHGPVAHPGGRGKYGRTDRGDGRRESDRHSRARGRRTHLGRPDRRTPAPAGDGLAARIRPQPGREPPGVAGGRRGDRVPGPGLSGATSIGRRLRMFDLAAGMPVERFPGFAGEAHDLYFIDAGKTVVTVEHYRRDAGVRLWDVATGRVIRSFPARGPDPVWRCRVSPDGKVLAVTYVEQPVSATVGRRTVKLWDIATGKELDGQPGHWDDDEVMAFAQDGQDRRDRDPCGVNPVPGCGDVAGSRRDPRTA